MKNKRVLLGRIATRSAVTTLLAFALSYSVPAAFAAEDAGGEHWSDWRAMGSGYAARRREAPPPDVATVSKRLKAKQVAKRKGLLKGTKADALWLKTDQEGLYKIGVAELSALTGQTEKTLEKWLRKGNKLALSNAGKSVPWHYDAASDSVLFVAQTIDTMFTGENAYRLVADNKASETMEEPRGRRPRAGSPEGAFLDTVKFEEDTVEPAPMYALWSVMDDPDADYWFWGYLYGGYKNTLSVDLDLHGAAATGQGEIRVGLRGWTELVPGNDHKVHAELNGVPIGDAVEWDGFDAKELVASFDQSLLQANNVLQLVTEYAPGTHPGEWLNEVHVSYWRQPLAENDQLWLHGLQPGIHTVGGFSTDQIAVIEAPEAGAKWRNDITIVAAGDGTFNVSFSADSQADFLVVGDTAVNTPEVTEDSPSTLAKKNNRVDYLIIAPRELAQTAEALRDYRRATFRRIDIAWYEDIVDEFNDGIEDPEAVTKFLTYAKNQWRNPPEYVVLIGKGTLDHKNLLAYSDSLLPVRMTTTPWGLAGSDNRYMDTNGDGLANFAYGRIPVSDDMEGLAYVEKLQAHEASQATSNRAVLVADNPDKAGDFHYNSDQLSSTLESFGYDVTKLYHPSQPSVRSSLITSGMWEAAFVNYDGHGSPQQIGANNNGEKFLNIADVDGLGNASLPVFAAMTCAVGDDTQPGMASLAGALTLKAGGGAIASFAPTGLSLDADAQVMSRAFTDALIGSHMRIGDAVRLTQQQSAGQVNDFMTRIYSVIGDPVVYVQ